jgi:Helix-turn-helix domain
MLANICTDDVIAGVLNRNGHKTGRGNRWTKERVAALRSHHQIPRYTPTHDIPKEWMNLTEAAEFLHVSPKTLRFAVEAGELRAEHPFSDGPWLFNRQQLMTPNAERVKERARKGCRRAAIPAENQRDLQFSST